MLSSSSKIMRMEYLYLKVYHVYFQITSEMDEFIGNRCQHFVRALPVPMECTDFVGASPQRQALDFLISQGWIMRNPGYGHPSRPEYVVTKTGAELAARCEYTLQALKDFSLEQVGLNRWTLPILFQLSKGPARFGELRKS